MNATWLKIFGIVLGLGEEVVPIFIHNPQSQQIEGVIVSTLAGILQGLGTPASPIPPAPTAPSTT